MTEREIQVPGPKQRYDALLYRISHNIFVTEASLRKRDELREHMRTTTTPQLQDLGIEQVVCFPMGSLAVGMANDASDFDVHILYSGPKPGFYELDPMRNDTFYLPGGAHFSNVEDHTDSTVMQNHFHSYLYHGDISAFDSALDVFYPSLNEFSDPKEKDIVDGWRKDALAGIVQTTGGAAELVWDKMRGHMGMALLRYETLDYHPKRRERVEDAIHTKLADRFPGNPALQERARSYVEIKRAMNTFPTLGEMLEAYEIDNTILARTETDPVVQQYFDDGDVPSDQDPQTLFTSYGLDTTEESSSPEKQHTAIHEIEE